MTMDLIITEVEFDKIKQELINYLSTLEEFQDFNFTGSGIQYLLNIMAYLGHYLSFQTNMTANELFITTAQLTKNIYSLAKTLNYIPRRPVGAIAYITLEIKDEYKPSNPATEIYIPKYTKFTSQNFNFYATEAYTLTVQNNYKFENISIKQGLMQESITTGTGQPRQTITLESTKVDNNEFTLTVAGDTWTLENDMTEIDENSETYRIDVTEDDYVKITFGDGVVGKIPPLGTEIKIVYADTEGLSGNQLSTFILSDILLDNDSGTYDNSKVTITLNQQSLGGADKETDESIKANAPLWYQSFGRLVTKTDYESFLANHEYVDIVNVWTGADDLYSPVYGDANIVIKPKVGNYLTDQQKTEILELLEPLNVLTVNPTIIDIDYMYMDLTIVAYYSYRYESQLNLIQSEIEQAITNFFNTEMNQFDHIFKYAAFVNVLFDLEKINNVNVTTQPHFYFHKVGTGNYYWHLQNDLTPGSILSNITSPYGVEEGFKDDSNGYIVTLADTTRRIGTVNYTVGDIEIWPGYEITAVDEGLGFRVNFQTPNYDVEYKQHRFILQKQSNITLVRSST